MAISDSLALSEDQTALQETLRGFLTDQLPSDELRTEVETVAGYSPQLHARLCWELGLAGLTIPEKFGGLGLALAETAVVHTELGRALYPGPFLPTCLATGVLLAAGDEDAAALWLPRLAEGSLTGTVAIAGEDGAWAPGADSVRATETDDGWRLSGQRWFVIAAHVAGIVAVPAVTEDGLAMFLVQAGSPGYSASGQLGLDLTRRVCITTFDDAPAHLLATGDQAVAALNRAEREFLLATAAEAAGGISWCLEGAVEYAKEREQFGQAIGSFQAVAHACVDMLADFQAISAAARYAAVTADEGAPDAAMAAHVAGLRSGEAYRRVTESAIHLFGGVGFTWEHDIQLYYRRAWSAERLAGGPHSHRAAIADLSDL